MTVATGPATAAATGPPHLTRTLVRLKIRLVRNRARKGPALVQLVLAGTSAAICVLMGGLIAFGLARSEDVRLSHGTAVIGATAMFLAWTTFPLLTFGTDESLDPSRLVLFPLPRRPLMRGLLAASLVGIAPTAAVLVTLLAGLAYSSGWSTLVVLPAAVVLVGLCASSARALSTTLGAGLQSRRGRDTVAIGTAAVFIALQGLRFVNWSGVRPDDVDRITAILRWLPPGMVGQAIVEARAGHTVVALAELVPAIVAIPLLLRVWSWALDRSSTVVRSGQTSTRRADRGARLPLLFRRLPFIAAVPWGAVAARELRYVARHPRRKVQLFNAMVFGIGGPILLAVKHGDLGSAGVLLASAAGYILVIGSSNQFGVDGGALWTDVVSPMRVREWLIGKNVAALVEILPVTLVAGVLLSALTGGWAYLPASLLLTVAGLGSGFATANLVSVWLPFRLPETSSPFGGSGGGQGCANGVLVLLALLAQNAVMAPVGIAAAIGLATGPVGLAVACTLSVAYGAAVYAAGLHWADAYGSDHLPEILEKVHPSRDA